MQTSTKYLTTFALAVTLIVSLAGCVAQAPTADPKPTHSSTAVATPKPTTAPTAAAPLVGDLDGNGVLDGWEKDQLARATYTMPDGSKVAVPADRPLPAPVVVAIQSVVHATVGPAVNGSAEVRGAHANAVINAVAAESEKIGRIIVPVVYGWDGDAGRFQFGVGGPAAGSYPSSLSEVTSVANATAWAARDATKYVVIVFK